MNGLLLLVLAQAATAPTAAAAPRSVAALRSDCLAGTSGDAAAGYRCSDAMLEYAAPLGGASDANGCLGSERGPASDLMWNWLSWLDEHPAPDEADAGASVTASILSRWPCGWSEG